MRLTFRRLIPMSQRNCSLCHQARRWQLRSFETVVCVYPFAEHNIADDNNQFHRTILFRCVKIAVLNMCFQIHELAMTRQLTSQITTKGAGLYDLLGKEVEMRVSGTSVIQYSSFLAKYMNIGTKAVDVQFHSVFNLHTEVCLLFMLLYSLYKYFAALLE